MTSSSSYEIGLNIGSRFSSSIFLNSSFAKFSIFKLLKGINKLKILTDFIFPISFLHQTSFLSHKELKFISEFLYIPLLVYQ